MAGGYTRIVGELKKLGIRVAKSTVKKILKAHGYDTGPERGPGTWADFIERHAATLWACDFLSVKTWTCRGVVEFYVLFFIHVQTRRVIVTGITEHPNEAWMAQQARNLAIEWGDEPVILKFPTVERERPKAASQPVGKIKRHQFLGGLLSHYERVAA